MKKIKGRILCRELGTQEEVTEKGRRDREKKGGGGDERGKAIGTTVPLVKVDKTL